jgi:hypothetical protein
MSLVFQLRFKVKNNPFVVSLSNHRKQPDKLRPFDELRMLGPFDRLSANGVIVRSVGRVSLVFQLRFKVKNNPFVVSLSNHFKPDNSIWQCSEL